MDPQHGRAAFRPDIQALRAVAVVSVLLFHLWPNRLTGGFVGVDVFFAISGFLITAHLLREAESTGRISLTGFWARRARRLLPASMLVLAASAAGTYVLAPQQLWKQFFGEIGASALYVQNWLLAHNAVDYLAAENAPSVVQHFWTLSAEEQFYAVWPILIGAVLLLARRRSPHVRRSATLGVLGVLVVLSLAYSVLETHQNPAAAYFVTPTRIWEFGLGAIVAFVWAVPTSRPPLVRLVLSWSGLAFIAVAAVTYTGDSPFPGYLAALPVVGGLMVIVAGPVEHAASPMRLGGLRPVQLLGDISYSLYLWHFPLIVLVPFALGHDSGRGARLGILAGSVLLAWATKVFVEDPVRFSPRYLGRRRPRVVFAWSAGAMAAVVVLAGGGWVHMDHRQHSAEVELASMLDKDPRCFGAADRDPQPGPCQNPSLQGILVPDPAVVAEDRPDGDICWSDNGESRLNWCTFGPRTGARKRIAVIGDSHSGQYRAAFKAIAKRAHWQVDMIGKSGCYWTKGVQTRSPEFQQDCETWKRSLNASLRRAEPYDAIVVSYKAGSGVKTEGGQGPHAALVEGLVDAWRPFATHGTEIVAIRDSPNPRKDVVGCVQRYGQRADEHCATSRKKAFAAYDGQADAARRVPGAHVIDLTDMYCGRRSCPPVIGHVVVYRDRGHVTDTYMTTLAPYLRHALSAVL